MDEPVMPSEFEDASEATEYASKKWHGAVLRSLALQLGVGNDFYYPLLGAAQLLDGLNSRSAKRPL